MALVPWRLSLCLVAGVSGGLLPIFTMHGVNDNHREFEGMAELIRAIDANVTITSLLVGDDSASFSNLWDQGRQVIDLIRKAVAATPKAYAQGYTLLCHSQGALICRTAIQAFDDHNVHTLISLAGPHQGQFGIPNGWDSKIPWGRDIAYTFFLTGPLAPVFQRNLSIANFWHDPRPSAGLFGKPLADYRNGNTFLPVFNSDPDRGSQGPGGVPPSGVEAARYKANLLRLRQAVFAGSPGDGTIIPWCSTVWQFYDEAVMEGPFPLLETTPLWRDDWVGLRTLHERGRLQIVTPPGVCHVCWAHDADVFSKHIAPWLPSEPRLPSVSFV